MDRDAIIDDVLVLMCKKANAQYELSRYIQEKHNQSYEDAYMILKYMEENNLVVSPNSGTYMITTSGYDIQKQEGYIEHIKKQREYHKQKKEADLASLTMKIYNKKTRYWSFILSVIAIVISIIALLK